VSSLSAQIYAFSRSVPNIVHTSAVYFIDPSGRERFIAAPMADHASSGTSYLPTGQIAAWGQGIAEVARALAGGRALMPGRP
jgi:hypothetical protein